jgi:predicted ArsR family transcriptional regulator
MLRLAAGRGTERSSMLARELGVSPELTRQMLDELARLGYVQTVVPGCSQPCEGCPLRTMCLYHRQPRIWVITAKGEKLLQKPGGPD